MEPFRVLCADPPWRFDLGTSTKPSKFRGTVDQHYQAMTLADIKAFEIPTILKDSTLILWRVAALLQDALDVAKAWNFVPKAEIVWRKQTKLGNRHFGMGRQVRMEHETALICARGRGAPVKNKSIRSVFDAPVGRHSEKPEIFYTEIVEQLYDGPYCELFARRPRPGWLCLGDELAVAETAAEASA